MVWLHFQMNAQPLKVIVWNVRGLNAPARRSAVYQVLTLANPTIVCLQETKLQDVSVTVVQQCLGNKFGKFFYLPDAGTHGGILVAWDESITQLSNPHYTNNTLTTIVKTPGEQEWWLTCV